MTATTIELAGLRHADHVGVLQTSIGWEVIAHTLSGIPLLEHLGPFRSKRDAVAWLRSWGWQQPLTYVEPGSWHWSTEAYRQ